MANEWEEAFFWLIELSHLGWITEENGSKQEEGLPFV